MLDASDRRIALERADAARIALNSAIDEIGKLAGNELYQKAWKKAASRIADLRDATLNQELIDKRK